MKQRSELIEWVRGDIVGASRWLTDPCIAVFCEKEFLDTDPKRSGPLAWLPDGQSDLEEVLYFEREMPHRKYGVGLLHPQGINTRGTGIDGNMAEIAAVSMDTLGFDPEDDETSSEGVADSSNHLETESASISSEIEEFEVSSPDVRHPSTLGVSFHVAFDAGGQIIIRLPQRYKFAWQEKDAHPFAVNGRYEKCTRKYRNEQGMDAEQPMWRRLPVLGPDCSLKISVDELTAGRPLQKEVAVLQGCPIKLRVDVFPRKRDDTWLLTVVLRNQSAPELEKDAKEFILFQSYFEVSLESARFERYPESERPFEDRDPEEKSLTLLYRESATWAIGHGCAAGWDVKPGGVPTILYADVFPATELPSVTADIRNSDGNPIQLSMHQLSTLPDSGEGDGWTALDNLANQYRQWISSRKIEAEGLPAHFRPVALEHLEKAGECHRRICAGIDLLRENQKVRRAFRLANEAMLLQQAATKALPRRSLVWNPVINNLVPSGCFDSPAKVVIEGRAGPRVGTWRAFQIAFLLMSLAGVTDGCCDDREVVDLIWFPTGGGKTEAYMGVLALYLFHERLLMAEESEGDLPRDGTAVLMRYTLRMLTTQQFQRAAALVCSMEVIRRRENRIGGNPIPGRRFSLGLWIGGEGAPNKISEAVTALRNYRRDTAGGNPMILTECPWCRAQIGRCEGGPPARITPKQWTELRVRGISENKSEGVLLHCPDPACDFGGEDWKSWLPVEVIDERIYANPPSLVIATADKFAMIAYRPQAGALFGRSFEGDEPRTVAVPPGLIIQDELHLISGPLGTMYALYEGVIEKLCSHENRKGVIKPKLIASTATIRGADEQVTALYGRKCTRLFPSPGLTMGDSFFGTYAQDPDGKLRNGRLYLGIHANDYGSILTTQVRAFSSLLFRPYSMAPEDRDPWWTLLAFYNSIRELGGAKTLFDSDIRSRLKFMFNREGFPKEQRRSLRIVEELTSRLSQAEIIGMMDNLSRQYSEDSKGILDACLASNIIEVGVDIDRLSLMSVVGQPKTTAQYIQVTGRVGRRWDDRPGLILTVYNPSKSRDRSHFEQFHSYHRRLYERVEPTTATPFAVSAIQRALAGVLLTWARQNSKAAVNRPEQYDEALSEAVELLSDRCRQIQKDCNDADRSLAAIERVVRDLREKWNKNPQAWEEFPPAKDGEYLMLWPGQFKTDLQARRGVTVPSSMRQVDGSAELKIVPLDN